MYTVYYDPENMSSKLIATKDIPANRLVWRFCEVELHSTPDRYTIQISETHHILDRGVIRYMNHSCDPNCIIDTEKLEVRSIRSIKNGEDLTFFYPSTEWDMAEPFTCLCNTEHCLGTIQGAAHLQQEEINRYYMNNHVLRLWRLTSAVREMHPVAVSI